MEVTEENIFLIEVFGYPTFRTWSISLNESVQRRCNFDLMQPTMLLKHFLFNNLTCPYHFKFTQAWIFLRYYY